MLENELDFSPKVARVLIQVAQNQWLVERTNWDVLPPNTSALLALSRLEVADLMRLREEGTIRPDMDSTDVPSQSHNLSSAGKDPTPKPPRPRLVSDQTQTESQWRKQLAAVEHEKKEAQTAYAAADRVVKQGEQIRQLEHDLQEQRDKPDPRAVVQEPGTGKSFWVEFIAFNGSYRAAVDRDGPK